MPMHTCASSSKTFSWCELSSEGARCKRGDEGSDGGCATRLMGERQDGWGFETGNAESRKAVGHAKYLKCNDDSMGGALDANACRALVGTDTTSATSNHHDGGVTQGKHGAHN